MEAQFGRLFRFSWRVHRGRSSICRGCRTPRPDEQGRVGKGGQIVASLSGATWIYRRRQRRRSSCLAYPARSIARRVRVEVGLGTHRGGYQRRTTLGMHLDWIWMSPLVDWMLDVESVFLIGIGCSPPQRIVTSSTFDLLIQNP